MLASGKAKNSPKICKGKLQITKKYKGTLEICHLTQKEGEILPSIHPSIHLFSMAKSKGWQGGAGTYPSCHWVKAWGTLDKLPVHHRADMGRQASRPWVRIEPGTFLLWWGWEQTITEERKEPSEEVRSETRKERMAKHSSKHRLESQKTQTETMTHPEE